MWPQVILAVAGIASMLQVGLKPHPFAVGHVCGKLVRVTKIPVKNSRSEFHDKKHVLAHATMQIFQTGENDVCCVPQSLVEQTRSGRWGAFRFKNPSRGLLWLVARVNGQDYKTLVEFDPKKAAEDDCSTTDYVINDSGGMYISKQITVD